MRIRITAAMILCIYILYFASQIALKSSDSFPVGIDYAEQYVTGNFAITGNLNGIYNDSIHREAASELIGREMPSDFIWTYPPTSMMLLAPFALLPFYPSMIVWLLLTFSLVVLALWLLAGTNKKTVWATCAFPGVFLTLRWGQNSFLSSALLGFVVYFMDTNPFVAGIMFGLLTYKAQFTLFLFVFFLFSKRWKLLFWSSIWTFITCILSALIFGSNIWLEFFIKFSSCSSYLTTLWSNISAVQPTVYSSLKLLGVNDKIIYVAVIGVFIATLTAVLWISKNTNRKSLSGAALVLGVLLTVPYLMQYDLMLLCIPLLLLLRDFTEYPCNRVESIVLFTLWLIPILSWIFVLQTGVQICPLVIIATLIVIIARVRNAPEIKQIALVTSNPSVIIQ